MDIARERAQLLVVTNNGFGKRTPIEEYRSQIRGGKGIITLRTTNKNGLIIGAKVVKEGDEIMIISREGIIIRIKVDDISSMSRTTQGVHLMKIGEEDSVVAIARVVAEDN
jgi:DNA gyrase subunit A